MKLEYLLDIRLFHVAGVAAMLAIFVQRLECFCENLDLQNL